MEPGAASSPQIAVNTTSVITRGFVSAKKSRHSVGIFTAMVVLAVISNAWPYGPFRLCEEGTP